MNIKEEFFKAITSRNPTAYRMHFRLPNDKVGITSAYTDKKILEDIRKEAEEKGHTYIKTEPIKK